MTNANNSDSIEQRRAEEVMVDILSQTLGVTFVRRCITLPDGSNPNVDGVSEEPFVLCEAWAHQGRPKGSQLKKPVADAFKLIYIERVLRRPARKILLFCNEDAAAGFRKGRWAAAALAAFEVEIHVVDIGDRLSEDLRAAQRRQYR